MAVKSSGAIALGGDIAEEFNTLSVSYGNLVGVLIESIKELKAEIDELKGN